MNRIGEFVCKNQVTIIVVGLLLFALFLRWCNSNPTKEGFANEVRQEEISSEATASAKMQSGQVGKEAVSVEQTVTSEKEEKEPVVKTPPTVPKCQDIEECSEAVDQIQPLMNSLSGLATCLKYKDCTERVMETINELANGVADRNLTARLKCEVTEDTDVPPNEEDVKEKEEKDHIEGFADLDQIKETENPIGVEGEPVQQKVCYHVEDNLFSAYGTQGDVSEEINMNAPTWMSYNRSTGIPLTDFGRPYLD